MAWWHGPDPGSTLAEVWLESGRLVMPWAAGWRRLACWALAGLVWWRSAIR